MSLSNVRRQKAVESLLPFTAAIGFGALVTFLVTFFVRSRSGFQRAVATGQAEPVDHRSPFDIEVPPAP